MKKCSVPKNSSVDNVRCIFEDNYIFVENFNTSSAHTSLFLKTVMIKFWGRKGRGVKDQNMGQRIEGQEKQICRYQVSQYLN